MMSETNNDQVQRKLDLLQEDNKDLRQDIKDLQNLFKLTFYIVVVVFGARVVGLDLRNDTDLVIAFGLLYCWLKLCDA